MSCVAPAADAASTRGIGVVKWWMLLSTVLHAAVAKSLPVALYAIFGHDDGLFWRQAQSLLSGDWLGEYSQYAMMKGPGYPFFLALNRVLGISVSVSQSLLYSGACALLAYSMFRVTGRRWLALVLFLAMQWHPMSLAWDRVLRDNISAAQVLLVLGCVVLCLFVRGAPWRRALWALAAGAVLGWFWLTREDGIWLLPGIALLFAGAFVRARREAGALRSILIGGSLLPVGFAAVLGAVAIVNLAFYGSFATVDFKGRDFKDALAALHRVRVGDAVPYVPVPEKVRNAVAGASPTFAGLQTYFEGHGRGWIHASDCRVRASTCGDYPGALFVWALRDAVSSVGGYASPEEAAAIYRRLADEINAACDDGRLDCAPRSYGFMPGVTDAQWRRLPAHGGRALKVLLWHDAPLPSKQGKGPVKMQYAMWRFIGRAPPRRQLIEDTGVMSVGGWFHARGEDTWLQMRCASKPDQPVEIQRRASPDIAAHFDDPGATHRRFRFSVDKGDSCALEMVSGDATRSVLRLDELGKAPLHRPLPAGDLFVDDVDRSGYVVREAPRWGTGVRRVLGVAWQALSPWLAALGMLAFVLSIAMHARRRQLPVALIVALAAWALAGSRLAMLVLVDVSSFSAINVQYMQPAFPVFVLAVVSSLASLPPLGWRKKHPPEAAHAAGDGTGAVPHASA